MEPNRYKKNKIFQAKQSKVINFDGNAMLQAPTTLAFAKDFHKNPAGYNNNNNNNNDKPHYCAALAAAARAAVH